MSDFSPDTHELIGLVYQAALEPERWLDVLDRMGHCDADALQQLEHWLLPHLERSLQLGGELDARQYQLQVMISLLDHLPVGLLLLDANGKVLVSNSTFRQICALTALHLDHHHLRSQHVTESQYMEKCLQGCLRQLADGYDIQEQHLRSRIAEPAWRVQFTPTTSEFPDAVRQIAPLVVLVSTPALAPCLDTARLRKDFSLTHTEMMLLELLAGSCHSVKELASYLGRNETTVRRQIASIYEKTETHGQLELIKLGMRYALHTYVSRKTQDRAIHQTDGRLLLHDGRTLSYGEYGVADGFPVVLAHGLAASRLLFPPDLSVLQHQKIRLIIPERPGYGCSSKTQATSVSRWAEDLRQLLNALHIEQCAIIGHVLGNIYAMAAAALLPERISVLSIVSGYGPDFSLQSLPVQDQVLLRMARYAPNMLAKALKHVWRLTHDRPVEAFQYRMQDLNAVEKEIAEHTDFHALYAHSFREATRYGVDGVINDLQHVMGDWNFSLQDIRCPVHIWHGRQDTQVPVAFAERLAEAIPGSRLIVDDDSGRMVIVRQWKNILSALSENASNMRDSATEFVMLAEY
jgi:pimeloyl-ACP methyl ester carboxylesterase/PAS domain-containing protein